jgi:hypothetical protein
MDAEGGAVMEPGCRNALQRLFPHAYQPKIEVEL